jgi:hypothetical protein
MTAKKKKNIDPPGGKVVAAETALEAIKSVFSEPKSLEKLLKTQEAQRVFTALGQFAEIDHASETQAPVAGEVLSKILALPLDSQKQLVWAMADSFGIPHPVYESSGAGRPTTGRNQLAEVLYSKYPDMLLKDKGKDTRAAKRITDHVRRFLIRTGARAAGRALAGEGGEEKPLNERKIRAPFMSLWEVAQSETEKRVLVALCMKLGITPETLDKWTDHAILRLAAAPLSATTIDNNESEK